MEKKKPRYTFVIPTYNEEKCILKTMKQFSPYRGKYPFEVIVVDGRSTDKTIQIARKYADTVIIEKGKSTIAAARNVGAFKARGDIIIEMDADVIHPDIPKLFSAIDKGFQDPQVVGATVKIYFYPEGANWKDHLLDFSTNFVLQLSAIFNIGIAKGECQILRKTTFYKVKGYNNALPLDEDGELFHRLGKIGKIKVFPDVCIHHSPRRFRKDGYFNVIFRQWLKNWIYYLFTGKSYVKSWKPVR